jgi:hypothetical protein
MALTRVPHVEEATPLPTLPPPGESATASEGGDGTREPYRRYRRFRWKGNGEDLTEPRLPQQPGEALLLGAQVDVLA